MAFDIPGYINTAGRVQVDDLDLDAFAERPLSAEALRCLRYHVCKGSAVLPVSPVPLPHTAASETAGLNTRSSVWPSRFVRS